MKMKKYFLSEGDINRKFNGSIVKIHIEDFLKSCGYTPIQYEFLFVKNFYSKLWRLVMTLTWSIRIPKYSIVVFHFPVEPTAYQLLLKWLNYKGVFTVALIHDFNGLRYDDKRELEKEKEQLRYCKHCIVHNSKMAEFLKDDVSLQHMSQLYLFDYKANGEAFRERKLTSEIALAANLDKTYYLDELLHSQWSGLECKVIIYGSVPEKIKQYLLPDYIVFKGAVQPEELPIVIEGSFGMVWDGDSIHSCTGSFGEYLRYNTPHKLSLYLAAGLPVIVWEQSAMAKWVRDQGVGILVNSWADAIGKIKQMSEAEYRELCMQAKKIGTRLRNGEFLKRVLEEIEAKATA